MTAIPPTLSPSMVPSRMKPEILSCVWSTWIAGKGAAAYLLYLLVQANLDPCMIARSIAYPRTLVPCG